MADYLEDFVSELKKDSVLYDIFICICNYSAEVKEANENDFLVIPKAVKADEMIREIQKKVYDKSKSIINEYIDKLVAKSLLQKIDESEEIILTPFVSMEITGATVYAEIKNIEGYKESEKEIEEELSNFLDGITEPYENKIKILEEKIKEVNRTIDSGIIKNIQVISIFAGIISLLFANIMGIKDFASIGVSGLLIINFCMVLVIFTLLLFTNLLIIGGKIKIWTIIICILVLLLLLVPIILIDTKIINLYIFI